MQFGAFLSVVRLDAIHIGGESEKARENSHA